MGRAPHVISQLASNRVGIEIQQNLRTATSRATPKSRHSAAMMRKRAARAARALLRELLQVSATFLTIGIVNAVKWGTKIF